MNFNENRVTAILIWILFFDSFVSHATQTQCRVQDGFGICADTRVPMEWVIRAWEGAWQAFGTRPPRSELEGQELEVRVLEEPRSDVMGVYVSEPRAIGVHRALLISESRTLRLLTHEWTHFIQDVFHIEAPQWFLEVQAIAAEEHFLPGVGTSDVWRFLQDPRGVGLRQETHVFLHGEEWVHHERREGANTRVYGLWNLWGHFLNANCFESNLLARIWNARSSTEAFRDPMRWVAEAGHERCHVPASELFSRFVEGIFFPLEQREFRSVWMSTFRGVPYARNAEHMPEGSYTIFLPATHTSRPCREGERFLSSRQLGGVRSGGCLKIQGF